MLAICLMMMVAALAGLYASFDMQQIQSAPLPQAQALAYNMGAYRQALIQYVQAHPNPAFQGSVPSVGLPPQPGYQLDSLWQNYVSGNTVVVYAATQPPAYIVDSIESLAEGSVMAGVANHGSILSPDNPGAAVPLPAGAAGVVPNGMPVWMAQVY